MQKHYATKLKIWILKDMARTLLRSWVNLKETLNLILDLSHIEADRLEISLLPGV